MKVNIKYAPCMSLAIAIASAMAPANAQDTASVSNRNAASDQAQGQNSGISDIIVTAQKRAERLQEVPIAISAIGKQALERQNVRNALDISRLPVPGLVTGQQTGQPVVQFNMRGVSSQDVQATMEGGVALYIDGVYIPRTQGLMGDLVDVERIEVLRGPQGTLFGRNAEGGAISIVSSQPTGEFGGEAGATVSEFGGRKGFVRLNLPEFANFSVKLSGYRELFDGYTKNAPLAAGQTLSQHRDYGARNNYGGRAQVLWEPSSDFSALFSADESRLKNTGLYNSFDTASPYSTVDPDRVKVSSMPFYNPYATDKVSGQSLALTYNLNDDVTLKSITSRRNLTSRGGFNLRFYAYFPFGPGLTASGLWTPYVVTSKTFSQELQLIGSKGEFEYTIGAFYFRERASDQRKTLVSILIPDGQPPVSVEPDALDIGAGSVQAIESNAFAIYGQTTWTPAALDDKLKITVGGRYTEDKKTAERTVFASAPLATPIRPDPARLNRFDPALTIAYQPTRDINIYARYAQSFRAGGVSVRSSSFKTFAAETIKSVELGFKADLFDRLLRFNAAAYHSWVKNQQINAIPPGRPTEQDIVNAQGTTKLRGLELEATLAPVEGLLIAGTLGLMGGKQPPYDCGACLGRTITFLPKRTIGLTVDYSKPVGFGEIFLHTDWKYQSEYQTSPFFYPGEKRPSVNTNVWNARVGIESIQLAGVEAKIAAFVDNVFDNHDLVFGTNVQFQTPRPPRTFGVEAGIKF